jgi:hypothetical protein
MRIYFLVAIVAFTLPLVGASKRQCRSACDRDYDLCVKRAANKAGRKTCAVFRKTCKRGCPAS